MPPERVARIVGRINALHPDIVVAAGDFVGNTLVGRDYPVADAIAPLGRLKATYGVYAVLGNNDYNSRSR
jgi:predicted MPP superfamily phosphohydrolase